jgi:hypothetical protein
MGKMLNLTSPSHKEMLGVQMQMAKRAKHCCVRGADANTFATSGGDSGGAHTLLTELSAPASADPLEYLIKS